MTPRISLDVLSPVNVHYADVPIVAPDPSSGIAETDAILIRHDVDAGTTSPNEAPLTSTGMSLMPTSVHYIVRNAGAWKAADIAGFLKRIAKSTRTPTGITFIYTTGAPPKAVTDLAPVIFGKPFPKKPAERAAWFSWALTRLGVLTHDARDHTTLGREITTPDEANTSLRLAAVHHGTRIRAKDILPATGDVSERGIITMLAEGQPTSDILRALTHLFATATKSNELGFVLLTRSYWQAMMLGNSWLKYGEAARHRSCIGTRGALGIEALSRADNLIQNHSPLAIHVSSQTKYYERSQHNQTALVELFTTLSRLDHRVRKGQRVTPVRTDNGHGGVL